MKDIWKESTVISTGNYLREKPAHYLMLNMVKGRKKSQNKLACQLAPNGEVLTLNIGFLLSIKMRCEVMSAVKGQFSNLNNPTRPFVRDDSGKQRTGIVLSLIYFEKSLNWGETCFDTPKSHVIYFGKVLELRNTQGYTRLTTRGSKSETRLQINGVSCALKFLSCKSSFIFTLKPRT